MLKRVTPSLKLRNPVRRYQFFPIYKDFGKFTAPLINLPTFDERSSPLFT